jgi:hypothetical protein
VALFLGVLAAELAVAAPAPALPAEAAPLPRRIVEIHVEGDRATLERVRAAAGELLSEISVTPVVVADGVPAVPGERSESPFVSAYFDFRDTPATIVIVDGASRRELDRRSLPPDTTLEAAVESAVHVLFMLVESLLDEQAAPSSETPSTPIPAEQGASKDDVKDTAPREHPAPVATTPPGAGTRAAPRQDTGVSEVHASGRREPPLGLGVGVLARVLHFGAGQMLPSAGAELELSFSRMRPRLGAVWYFAASTPFVLSSPDATAKLYPFSSGLLPNVEFDLGEDFSAIAGAGVVLTWFSLSSAGPPGAVVGHSTGGVDTALSAMVGVRARTGPRFSLTLLGALDYDLEPRSFVAFDGGGGRHVLGALAQWRPSLSFVVAYSLFGGAARTNVAEAD